MSIENELTALVLERIVEILKTNLPATRAQEKAHFFIDTVMEYRDGKVILKDGFADNRVATVLNNGIFDSGESTLVIRTADGSLWAYTPYGVGPVVREKLFSLRNVYIMPFIDRSGSMDEDVPAIEEMLTQLREEITKAVYGGDVEKAAKYLLPTLYDGSERFVLWMGSAPPSLDEGEATYSVITLSFINESDNIYGSTVSWTPGTAMTSAFNADLETLKSETARRDVQRHLVFNVERYYGWTYGAFLADATEVLKEYGFSYENVPPDQPASYYLELIQKTIKEWGG